MYKELYRSLIAIRAAVEMLEPDEAILEVRSEVEYALDELLRLADFDEELDTRLPESFYERRDDE